jgi:hypothetical protein
MSAVLDCDHGGSLRLFHRGEIWNVGNALAGTGRVERGDGGPGAQGEAALGRGMRTAAKARKRSASGQHEA